MARNDHNTQAFAAEHSGYARDDEAVTFWERSRRRAQADRGSWDYGQSPTSIPKQNIIAHSVRIFCVYSITERTSRRSSRMCSKPRSKSHMTGYYRESHWLSFRISRLSLGISSLRLLQAKTAIAPLDRVKILFQTSNADFKQYAGEPSRDLPFGVPA